MTQRELSVRKNEVSKWGESEAWAWRCGITVTIRAMFLLFLSMPGLAAVLECSRGVWAGLYANTDVERKAEGGDPDAAYLARRLALGGAGRRVR